MSPLYQLGAFGYPVAMALATALGVAFGFVLERAGFGRAGVLVAQFYGDDMRVLKVMFSGVVTTMVGLGILGQLGIVDLTLIRIPETFIGPAVAGGLLLGIGFVISGYCPGTALVALASGHVDGLVALLGIMAGSLAFGFGYDALEAFYLSGGHGKLTFVEVLGVSWPILAFGVTLLAVGAFFFGEWVERRLAPKHGRSVPPGNAQLRNALFGGFVLVAALGVATTLHTPPVVQAAPARQAAPVDVLTLAERLASGLRDLYIVDLRAPADCEAARIPGAMCMGADDADAAFAEALAPTRTLVVYGADGAVVLPAGVQRFKGALRVLDGGYAAWTQQILAAPTAPTPADAAAVERYRRRASLHAYFTGAQAPAAPIVARPTGVVRRAAPRGGGC